MDDLDRWTRVLPLGTGAFGEVHLAWDHVDSRWVALKRFTGQDELGLLRMVIESRIRVSHPHLVRTLAFRLVDDRAWLVTELARGGSLRALMTRTGALPWGWVAEAVDQVLAALTALHASGVVHRDLKPANLLLRSFGPSAPDVVVGDFGIATWRTVSMTGIGAAIGTPGYLAPEYLDGHAPSPATDLFAVGVLAAEMLTGRRLVHYSNASPTMPSSWRDELPVPAEVPPALATVLRRMAAPDPGWRYRDCTQAREALLSAVPPSARGDLTTVDVPDLLAAVPPGWTPEGPEQPTTALSAAAAPHAERPADAPETELNLVGLPIDGGPTGLVREGGHGPVADQPGSQFAPPGHGQSTHPPADPAALPSGSPGVSPSGSATPAPGGPPAVPATPAGGSAIPTALGPSPSASGPANGSPGTGGPPASPPDDSATPPRQGPAAFPATPPSGSTTPTAVGPSPSASSPPNGSPGTDGPPASPSHDSATPPATPQGPATPTAVGSSPSASGPANGSPGASGPPATSAAPPSDSATPSRGSTAFPATPPHGSAAFPVTPPGGSASSPGTPPRGSAVSTPAERKAARRRKVKRKVKQAVLLVVLVVLVAGGGSLWWAATHRTLPGHASASGGATGEPTDASRWTPTVVAPCAAVEIDSRRTGANGNERCQRTPNQDSPQSWVEEPPGGFPKSNAAGPFPGESCPVDGDRDYSPVGDHVECQDSVWRVIA